MHEFSAIIRKVPGAAYLIEFPDVPGCISAADSLEEVVVNAAEALAFHLEFLAIKGLSQPEPTHHAETSQVPSAYSEDVVAFIQIPAKSGHKFLRSKLSRDPTFLKTLKNIARQIGATELAL